MAVPCYEVVANGMMRSSALRARTHAVLTLYLLMAATPRAQFYAHHHAGDDHDHEHAWGTDAFADHEHEGDAYTYDGQPGFEDDDHHHNHIHTQTPFQLTTRPAAAVLVVHRIALSLPAATSPAPADRRCIPAVARGPPRSIAVS